MAETIEYIVGFAISTSVAVFSMFVLGGSSPIVGRFVQDAGRSQVVDAARQAILENSTRSVSLDVSGTSIACSHGRMNVTSPRGNYSSNLLADCSFSISHLSGVHRLTFSYDGRELVARSDG